MCQKDFYPVGIDALWCKCRVQGFLYLGAVAFLHLASKLALKGYGNARRIEFLHSFVYIFPNHGVGSTDHAKIGIGQYVNIARFFVTHISFKNDAANIQKNNGNT